MLLRCGVLFCKFGPVVLLTPFFLAFWRYGGEDAFWRLLLSALDSAGPTFVKLGQWASTRPDLLPASTVRRLATLQTRTKPHTFSETKKLVAEAFGPDWGEEIQLDPAPVGSGCIGQVYHGWVKDP